MVLFSELIGSCYSFFFFFSNLLLKKKMNKIFMLLKKEKEKKKRVVLIPKSLKNCELKSLCVQYLQLLTVVLLCG